MYSTEQTTEIQLGTDAATTNPTPSGEVNHDLKPISNMDTRFGVPVPIGARVQAGEIEGVVVASTDQLAIIRDDQGRQFAERWGVVLVQASGPASATLPYKEAAGPNGQGLLAITGDQLDQLDRDPYRRAALRALDLLAFIDAMQEEVESIENDRVRAADELANIEALLGQIADNRARRLVESGVAS